MSAISGMRRPNLSPSNPKMNAPTGRIIRVSVIAKATLGMLWPKFVRDRDEHEGEEEKIERVEGPAEEAGEESVALVASQRLEKPDRFHRANLAFRAAKLGSIDSPTPTCILIVLVLVIVSLYAPDTRSASKSRSTSTKIT